MLEDLQQIIDEQTEPWGIKVTTLEIKDVGIPSTMQRAMARQAEASASDAPRSSTPRASTGPPPSFPGGRDPEPDPAAMQLRYDLPYTSGPLPRQYAQVVKRVLRLALPGGGESLTEHVDADRQAAPRAAAAA